ncbi:MAG: tyrosine--tRNA ligase [Proteobacteria bacterium]|nr:tyrosine--tRNA ligase [Pseudomonadota bacterium]
MADLIDILEERGFIEKTTHDEELKDYIRNNKVTCYIGFDPTASSLHVGSLVPIMALAHMQKNGHRPIALIGGGTGLIGDPSGKTEMRKLLASEMIEANINGIKEQLSRFIDFSDNKALLVNNNDWLSGLKYIPFLRDIGRCFSVNRMIKAESYKMRLDSEEGLSFIEFNYMLLQAYDFLELFDKYKCRLQMGGSDQWGNIVAGIELIRKIKKDISFGITFPLIKTSNGAKMGKTAKGAVWLDSSRTTPYDYYQYWINTDDRDVARFLALFTFLPIDEIKDIEKLEGADLNSAKVVLAFETTLLAHGRDEAVKAFQAAACVFGERLVAKDILTHSSVPRVNSDAEDISVPCSYIDNSMFKLGIPAFKLFNEVKLAPSGAAARRLIEQGGGYVNDRRIEKFDELITSNDINEMEILLRSGKKRIHKIRIKQ